VLPQAVPSAEGHKRKGLFVAESLQHQDITVVTATHFDQSIWHVWRHRMLATGPSATKLFCPDLDIHKMKQV
jgi:hypothetical protein